MWFHSDLLVQTRASLGRFEVAHFVFCTEGAATNQPRAAPWVCVRTTDSRPERALQKSVVRPVAPFQGFCMLLTRLPRALPWSDLLRHLRCINSAASKLSRQANGPFGSRR